MSTVKQKYLKNKDEIITPITSSDSVLMKNGNTLTKELEDTGWKDVTFYSGFKSRNNDSIVQIRKVGKVIYLKGQVKITKDLAQSATEEVKVFTIPSQFKINRQVKFYVNVELHNSINTSKAMVYCHSNGVDFMILCTSAIPGATGPDHAKYTTYTFSVELNYLAD